MIRRLDDADVPSLLALTENRGWAYDAARWRLMLSIGESWGIDAPEGGLAGTVSLFRSGAALASVGMMLVHTAQAGRGLGRALMEHVIGEAGGVPLFLYATEAGRPLYEKLGFRAVDALEKYSGEMRAGTAVPRGDVELRELTGAGLADVERLDEEGFGAQRPRVLRALFAERFRGFVATRAGVAVGYGISTLTVEGVAIGPVVARDGASARALAWGLAAGAGKPLRLDVPGACPGLGAWALEVGLASGGAVPLMVRGMDQMPGRRDRVCAVAGRALG